MNVVVSALFSPGGTPAALLMAWLERRFDLLVSPPMRAELLRVLDLPRVARRIGWSQESRIEFLERLASGSLMIDPGPARIAVSRDPDDDLVFELAAVGGADYIVSGDADVLVIGSYEGIPILILTPAQFLAVLDLEPPAPRV